MIVSALSTAQMLAEILNKYSLMTNFFKNLVKIFFDVLIKFSGGL